MLGPNKERRAESVRAEQKEKGIDQEDTEAIKCHDRDYGKLGKSQRLIQHSMRILKHGDGSVHPDIE